MATKKAVEEIAEVEPTFDREQILNSARYQERVDIVGALLVSGKSYTLSEVDGLIEDFNKKEIKTC
ncbi:MAG: hypothetical protein HY818_17315, partial [Acetobacterium woodii]|nr:hypothetical protein [Acetobacterium woodii]